MIPQLRILHNDLGIPFRELFNFRFNTFRIDTLLLRRVPSPHAGSYILHLPIDVEEAITILLGEVHGFYPQPDEISSKRLREGARLCPNVEGVGRYPLRRLPDIGESMSGYPPRSGRQ